MPLKSTPNTHCLVCNRSSKSALCARCAEKEARRQRVALANGLRVESLRPLLDSSPRFRGEEFVEALPGKKAICLSCGARDYMIMIRKHKKNCSWVAWFKALDTLKDMLGTGD